MIPDPVPTSADASRMLREITPVGSRSRRLARDVTWARSLLAWGLAWTSGTIMYQLLPRPVDLGAVVLATGLAGGLSMTALGAWRMRWRR